MPEGWVYVLTNEHMPGVVKIGQTANEPKIRASELQTTGVPGEFVVEYQALFEDYARIERSAHRALVEHRVSSNREFFRIDVARAILAIRDASSQPPKREESKEGRLRQAEQAKRQAELEARKRQEQQRLEDEANAQASRKMTAHNVDQEQKIASYIKDNYEGTSDWGCIILIAAVTITLAVAYIHPIIGLLIMPVAYTVGISEESNQKNRLRQEAEKLFVKKDFNFFYTPPLIAKNLSEKPTSTSPDTHLKPSEATMELHACPHCATKNRILGNNRFNDAKCGKCGAKLIHGKKVSENSQGTSSVDLNANDIERLLERLKSYGLKPEKIGSNWRVLGKLYIPYELYSFEREFVKKFSETEAESTSLNISDDRKISFEKSISDDFEKLIERLKSYGLKPEKIGSNWQVQGRLYTPYELYEFERFYLEYREKVSSGYHFGSTSQVEGETEIVSKSEERDEDILAKLGAHGFEVERFASNWRIDGSVFFPDELSQFEQKCTPQRLAAVNKAPQVAELLKQNGFSVQKNRSNWLVDGELLSPEQMVQLEEKCTSQRAAAVKRAPAIAEILRKHGVSVESKWSNWLVDGSLLSPEELVRLNPDNVAMRLRDKGYSVLKIGLGWKFEGEVISTKNLIEFENNDE
jgi:broad-specificity NMP kinase